MKDWHYKVLTFSINDEKKPRLPIRNICLKLMEKRITVFL